MQQHRSQLLVCHEHIDEKAASSAHPESYAFCDLAAESWCLDCSYYVCQIHAVSRHERHRMQSVADEQESGAEAYERRSGTERRKA